MVCFSVDVYLGITHEVFAVFLLKGSIFAETFPSAINRRSDQARDKKLEEAQRGCLRQQRRNNCSLSQKKPWLIATRIRPAMFIPAIECLPGIPGGRSAGWRRQMGTHARVHCAGEWQPLLSLTANTNPAPPLPPGRRPVKPGAPSGEKVMIWC